MTLHALTVSFAANEQGLRFSAIACLFFGGLFWASIGRGAPPAEENARWNFLVTNLDIFPGTEQLFQPDEKLFWRLKEDLRNVKASEKLPDAEYRFKVSTSAEGYRLVPKSKTSDTSVLFLGDSCTFGIPVNDEEAFPARTQKLLDKEGIEIQAINAGVPGYSAFQGRLQLEQLAEPPDIVVVTFWPNGRSIWDHLSDAEHEQLLAAERSGEFSGLRFTRLWRRATPGNRQRLNDEEFAEQLRRIAAWCRENGEYGGVSGLADSTPNG